MIQCLVNRLEKSEIFHKFKAENPNAFSCIGFFILNYKSKIMDYSLDFRDEKQLFSFKIPEKEEDKITLVVDNIIEHQKAIEEISFDVQIDLEDLKEIVEKALLENQVKNKLEDIIAVLQKIDGKRMWNLTCMCEGFTIVSMHIDSEKGNVLKFEKKSLFDLVKKQEKPSS